MRRLYRTDRPMRILQGVCVGCDTMIVDATDGLNDIWKVRRSSEEMIVTWPQNPGDGVSAPGASSPISSLYLSISHSVGEHWRYQAESDPKSRHIETRFISHVTIIEVMSS